LTHCRVKYTLSNSDRDEAEVIKRWKRRHCGCDEAQGASWETKKGPMVTLQTGRWWFRDLRWWFRVLRDLPYQTWPQESRAEGSVDFPSGWLNIMMSGVFNDSFVTKTDQTVLTEVVDWLKNNSVVPEAEHKKVVVNVMSTAWPFTMGGHVDVSDSAQRSHVLATTLVLVDNPGPIVTLAGLRARTTSALAASVRHYARLVRGSNLNLRRDLELATDGPNDGPNDNRDGLPFRLYGNGKWFQTPAGLGVVLESTQWNALNNLFSDTTYVPVHMMVRTFVENDVESASISFMGSTNVFSDLPRHPGIRPCPLPNEPSTVDNQTDCTKRNAYLQILTNESGLYPGKADTAPLKLLEYYIKVFQTKIVLLLVLLLL
jgi:hypothetical protein